MYTAFHNKHYQVSELSKKSLITVGEHERGGSWSDPQGVRHGEHDLQVSFIHLFNHQNCLLLARNYWRHQQVYRWTTNISDEQLFIQEDQFKEKLKCLQSTLLGVFFFFFKYCFHIRKGIYLQLNFCVFIIFQSRMNFCRGLKFQTWQS